MDTALITGASSGIGYEFAHIFAREKINLVLVARNRDKLDSLANDLRSGYGIKILVIAKDLGEEHAVEMVLAEVKAQNIVIDYLINNAGFGEFGLFHETAWNKEKKMIEVNIIALTALTKFFLSDMVKRNTGRILNVASTAAFMPGPLMAVYYASKAYVLHFSEAIAEELKDTKVTVTVLCPGPTESGFQEVAGNQDSKLTKGKKLPSSKEVAELGYKAMMRGQRISIHGFLNYVLISAPRLLPRSWVTSVVRKVSEKKK
ncbi:MAG: SDR family oxidoreductase [Bacteroidota bacterium]|nr:SDR family oxidoreductase [Bacteroidota bacterium]